MACFIKVALLSLSLGVMSHPVKDWMRRRVIFYWIFSTHFYITLPIYLELADGFYASHTYENYMDIIGVNTGSKSSEEAGCSKKT